MFGKKRCNSWGGAASLRVGCSPRWRCRMGLGDGRIAGNLGFGTVFWPCIGLMRWKSGQILAKDIVAVIMPVVLLVSYMGNRAQNGKIRSTKS